MMYLQKELCAVHSVAKVHYTTQPHRHLISYAQKTDVLSWCFFYGFMVFLQMCAAVTLALVCVSYMVLLLLPTHPLSALHLRAF